MKIYIFKHPYDKNFFKWIFKKKSIFLYDLFLKIDFF